MHIVEHLKQFWHRKPLDEAQLLKLDLESTIAHWWFLELAIGWAIVLLVLGMLFFGH